MLGFYIVNKATGTNSTKVVSAIKHLTHEKCGHLGTLDPLAAGVLPVAVGKATKLFDYFLNKDKKYYAIGLFGVETETLDSAGKVINRQNVNIQKSQIEAVLPQFCGKIKQIPPKYSAIKINGQRAYDLAREGKEALISWREIEIFDISVSEKGNNLFEFNIHCSSGTYVRTLINDIAKAVGTFATTICIIRQSSGPFTIEMSNTLEDIKNGNAKLYGVEEVLNIQKIEIENLPAKRLLAGQTIITDFVGGESLILNNKKPLGLATTKNKHTKLTINMWEEDK